LKAYVFYASVKNGGKETMNVRRLLFGGTLALGLVGTGYMIGQGAPPPDVDPKLHPNLSEAQLSCDHAYEKVQMARRDNKNDMGGHAERALQLLTDASKEIKLAAMYATQHPQHK
jgi:hypothetical protein